MMQDSLLDYAKGKADIRACEDRIRQIDAELAAAGKVLSLPPLKQAEAAARMIADPANEPTSYEDRRTILEGIIDLRMKYFDGDLEITGAIPVPAASAASGKKNRDRGLSADPE